MLRKLMVITADTDNRPSVWTENLHDGQTGEILAVAQIRQGLRWGMVNDRSHQPKTLAEDAGWDDANEYINAMMTDDRKQ